MRYRSDITEILDKWIALALKYEMTDKIPALWLLHDYAVNIFSENYYRDHIKGVEEFANSITTEQPEAHVMREFCESLIQEFATREDLF